MELKYLISIMVLLPVICKGSRVIFPSEHMKAMKANMTSSGGWYKIIRPQRDGSCYTREGIKGSCVPRLKCQELIEFIKSRKGIHTPGTADIIRNRICNFRSSDIDVCCINNAPTPNSNGASILPSMDDCGSVSVPKVTQGRKYSHGEHPWLVGLGYMIDGKIKVGCGGTLITRKHVLTAAHCFYRNPKDRKKMPQYTHVILGEHNLLNDSEKEAPLILQIAERKSPGYNNLLQRDDIELLVLEKEVSFTPYIAPACLPFEEYVQYFDLETTEMLIAGWGATYYGELKEPDEPLQGEVNFISKTSCQNSYKDFKNIIIDDTQLCLDGNGTDTCQGDSGGPVILRERKKYFKRFVIGISSFGVICGDPLYPGVYTYVPKYMNWILNNL